MKIKPIPYSLSCAGYELIYKCPKCDRRFNLGSPDWHYCPYCGQELDWGIITTVNEEWKCKFLDVLDNPKHKAQMLRIIEELNSTITDGRQYKMQVTDATRRAITKSNISYYLSNGWTKDELIKRGFFTKEDFDNVGL